MTQEKIRKVHLLYGAVTAVLVLSMAIMLIISCVNIYQSGDRAFSRESIGEAMDAIALPCWLCIAAVLGGGFLQLALPVAEDKTKPFRNQKALLARFRVNASQLPANAQKEAQDHQKKQKMFAVLFYSLVCINCLYPVYYFCQPSNFGVADITGDVLRAVFAVAIPGIVIFAAGYLWQRWNDASVQKEIEVYKANGIKPGKLETTDNKSKLKAARMMIAAVAVIFILLGILNEGYVDVLGKAIKICTECIGLG